MAANAEEIQGWIVRETGGIPPKAALETDIAGAELDEAAALASAPYGELLRSHEPRLSMARRVPAGVVGRDLAVQLPAHPLDALGGAGAGGGQRGGAQARPAHGGGRGHRARAAVRGGRAARGRAARAARRGGCRRGGGRGPAGADRLVHRLDGGGAEGGRGGGAAPQARAPRARRQLGARRARRRRPRADGVGGGVRLVHPPGPGVHDHRPAHRPCRRGRRVRGAAGREGVPPAGGEPGDRPGRARADDRRRPARPHPRARDRERGRRRPGGRWRGRTTSSSTSRRC